MLQTIKKNGTLNVVLINSSSTYYLGGDGKKGFEYELLSSYASHLGVDLDITVANTAKEALELSRDENIHITSALLAKTTQNEQLYNMGPAYLEVQEQMICNRLLYRASKFPKDTQTLSNLKIKTPTETKYSTTLKELLSEDPTIVATFSDDASIEEILAEVASGETDCTIVDSNIFSINQRYYSDLAYAFTIGSRDQLAWVLNTDSSGLKEDLYEWINIFTQSGELARIKDHYFDNNLVIDHMDSAMFYKRAKTLLPKYVEFFKEASIKYEIPYNVLVALSYQESQWNKNAVSPTGVRGLMMLTLDTAKTLKVVDRVDPRSSIIGGARHLRELMDRLDEKIVGEHRIKFALAAYNIGLGHIFDAIRLAEKMGKNAYAWQDLKSVLPLLAQRKHYSKLRHGYARGSEAIKYVESIFNYSDMLYNTPQESK